MADLADKVDDLICTFNGTLNATVDTLVMYMFGVFVFVLLVFVIVFHVYGKYRKPKATTAGVDKLHGNSLIRDAKAVQETQKNGSITSTSAGKGVPSSPAVRRRLGSKSGKITNISPTKGKSLMLPPSATGADIEAVQWVNDFFGWLFSDSVIVNELANEWIQALNDTMKPSVAEHGVGVELIRMLPEANPPLLNNIFCECASNDDIKITCDCEVTPAMQLKAFRQKGDKVEVSHYRVNVSKLRSRLNITCITEKLQVHVKFDGWPEIKIMLAQVGSLKNNNLDEQSLQEVIVDIVSSALRNTSVDFSLGSYSTCPRFVRRPVSPVQHLPLHYDSLLTSSDLNSSKYGDKLMVKVVKGHISTPIDGASYDQFCVVEVDNPPQTNQTRCIRGTELPNWNEQFIFNVNSRTKEIMFEVYNKSANSNEKNKFLGLAIVSVLELMESTSQRQVIALQSRPYQNDKVFGTLTLEFAFIDPLELYNGNAVRKGDEKSYASSTPNKGRTITSKTVYSSPIDRDCLSNGVTEKALKDLESAANRNINNMSPNKSTVIIHSVQKHPQTLNPQQMSQTMTRRWQEVHFMGQDGDIANNGYKKSDPVAQNDTTDSQKNGDDAGRGRPRRRRDFFGTIRRRLNRSRTRAKSCERNGYMSDVNGVSDTEHTASQVTRGTSVDRAPRDPSAHSQQSTGSLKVGPLPREGSTRSSLSEMSGVSGASSRTYLNEASTLVLETIENGITKYYLVPLSLAQKNKWKKKGTKLHIYNEHVFVAKHLPGGTACQICNRTLPRRLGKQGYECRDCSMKCHKRCHVRTDVNCPSSSVPSLELSGSLNSFRVVAAC